MQLIAVETWRLEKTMKVFNTYPLSALWWHLMTVSISATFGIMMVDLDRTTSMVLWKAMVDPKWINASTGLWKVMMEPEWMTAFKWKMMINSKWTTAFRRLWKGKTARQCAILCFIYDDDAMNTAVVFVCGVIRIWQLLWVPEVGCFITKHEK